VLETACTSFYLYETHFTHVKLWSSLSLLILCNANILAKLVAYLILMKLSLRLDVTRPIQSPRIGLNGLGETRDPTLAPPGGGPPPPPESPRILRDPE
jgi:hypothetical protein